MARRLLAAIAALCLVIGQAGSALGAVTANGGQPSARTSAPVDKGLLAALDAGTADRFVVEFTAKPDFRGAVKITNHAKRGEAVLSTLTANARKSQAAAVALAKKAEAKATSYWLTNVLVVKGNSKLAKEFAKLAGVKNVRALKVYPLVKPVETKVAILAVAGDPEWGVDKIRAPEAWADGIVGQGVVVGNVDTGVDYTHPALVTQYRGNLGGGEFDHNYNWWDPTGICGDGPCDNAGHGTHTMGTMVGGDGPGPFTPDVGVAPGARWVAAKGCEDFGCTEESLLSSGEFILAPTDLAGENPDPSKRPDIVNNSWGSGPGDPFYLSIVEAWRAAGIIPIFSSGNPGPECGQGGSPGDFPQVFSAGATDINDVIADFSGRGPSVYGKINPDISAPGVDVVSSIPGGGYEAFSGTSMAAPHTAGTIALILSGKPALIGDPNNYTAVTDAVRATAVDRIDASCGGDPSGDPNNVYGDGRIDAQAAVDLVSTGGTLAGTVTNANNGRPIGGAQVTAAGGFRDFTVTADENGHYEMFLAAGTYNVSAVAFGFALNIAAGVEIFTDATTQRNFALEPLPRFRITGHVRAAEDGSPFFKAHVLAIGTPVPAARTDRSGAYSLTLPIGTYTIRGSAGGCTEAAIVDDVELVNQNITLDFSLGRKLDDFGHGCRPIQWGWVDATTQSALYGNDFGGRLRLPFPFKFYGTEYQQIFISDNGYINFLGADVGNSFPLGLPSEGPPNAAIYAFWRDLFLADESAISYATLGRTGQRVFVLEFEDIGVRGTTSTVDFEIKLYEVGETLDILYGRNLANPGDGRGAAIGIENETGTDALEFSFSESLIVPQSAYRYEPMPSGVVHGTVTDKNDGEPIAGATVRATPGLGQTKTAEDGTYTMRLYPGLYSLNFSATNYVTRVTAAKVLNGSNLSRNARLNAPIPTVNTAEVAVELDFGAAPVTRQLTLGNGGMASLTWEAKERSRGSSPPIITPDIAGSGAWRQDVKPAIRMPRNGGGTAIAHPKVYRWTAANPTAEMSILVYADDPIHPAPLTYVDQALQRLGLSYTAHYDADFEGFQADLESGSWDLVIFADDQWGPDFALFDSLNAYVEGGGRLILNSWVVEFDPTHPLWERLGFSFAASDEDPPDPVHWWQPEHPVFTFPEVAPEPSELDGGIYGIYGQRGDALPGAEAMAGYTTPGPDAGQAALVIANGDRTAFKGFLDGQNSADLDSDGVPDGVELWQNLAFGISSGFFTDVPWLSESPTIGGIAAGGSQQVTLTIGDPGLAPGEYRASVVFITNAPKPHQVTVDVNLTVTLPDAWGAITGRVVDAHSPDPLPGEEPGIPVPGVAVTLHSQWNGAPFDLSATTAADGKYTLIGPSGTWPLEFTKEGWVTLTRNETVAAGETTTVPDALLHKSQPHGTVQGPPLTFMLTPGQDAHGEIVIANADGVGNDGHVDLTFEIGEVNLGGATLAGVTGKRQLAKVSNPNARSTTGANRPAVTIPRGIQATGEVLESWPTVGLELPWGIAYTGNVWVGDAFDNGDLCSVAGICSTHEFTTSGTPTGESFESPWIEVFGGDMAFDSGRGLIWQVNVGGDNGIYGLDPADGSVEEVITGSPWATISQRGLAYDPATDVFYIGGWNEGIVYRVAGLSHPTPGETLSQCQPADPTISGLAWNGSFGMLWMATNSEFDSIYLIDPETCDASLALAHPSGGGGNGAGIELDAAGNLWTVSQNTGEAFLIESGLPLFSDAPWLSVNPVAGLLEPGEDVTVDVHVDATGLEPGAYRAILVVQTNDPELGNVSVPVELLVPAYQRGVNAGGGSYVDPATGITYAADQAFAPGGFGYVGGTTQSSAHGIDGTTRDAFYQDLRTGMSDYRFAVPNGTYRVDLSFADLEFAAAGERVFSIAFEDSPLVWQLDVAAVSGGQWTAHDRTVFVEVADGVLDLSFVAQRGDDPIINGILVTEIPLGSP